MKYLFCTVSTMIIFIFATCAQESDSGKVLTGLDRISSYAGVFKGKKIGIITNHTAYDKNNMHIIDIFLKMKNVKVNALFGPEHGIRGNKSAGQKINDGLDPATQIPIFSLYGKIRKPTVEMIKDCDLLVFDIQDIGARYYTYISTMALAMEAAAENDKNFVILDRPNPINGIDVEGNVLQPEYASFVGMFPIAVRHGMTVGELAKMINNEGWLKDGIKSELIVIPMSGWRREMWYDDTRLTWRPPSPNIPDLPTATVYPGICLFEGTNISEGRGTYQPFLNIGAPWYNENNFSLVNKILDRPGLRLAPISFVPKAIKGMSLQPKFLDNKVQGLVLSIIDRVKFKPYISGIALVKYFYDQQKEKFEWKEKHFDRLCGTDQIRKFIISGRPPSEIEEWCKKDLETFLDKRSQYLIY